MTGIAACRYDAAARGLDARRETTRIGLGNSILDKERLFFTGSIEQIREDIARARALGTTELIVELDLAPGIDELLATMDRLRALAE